MKKEICWYKELVNQTAEKLRRFTVELEKKVEDKNRLCQLRNKYYSDVYKLQRKTKVLYDKLQNLALNNEETDHKLIIHSDNKDIPLSQPLFS